MNKRKVGAVAAAAIMAVSVVGMTATSAMAAGRDGVLNVGEAGFRYLNGCTGSLSDFETKKADLGTSLFISAGAGSGTLVKNHAECASNARTNQNMRVYTLSNYMGYNDLIPAASYGNLTNTWNDEASFQWLG
jgi:ABC-type uncharacterized transport system permease subunit